MPGTETKEILYISGNQEPISPSEQLQIILGLCDGVFTDQFIFGHMVGGGGGVRWVFVFISESLALSALVWP